MSPTVSERLSPWLSSARLIDTGDASIAPSPGRQVRLEVEEDQTAAKALAQVYTALTRERASATSCRGLLALCLAATADIGARRREHPMASFIAEQFRAFDAHMRHYNGAGLTALDEPFQLTAAPDVALSVVRASVTELLGNIAGVLATEHLFPIQPPDPAHPPRVLVVNGLHRTGSTRAFLAAQAILTATGRTYRTASHGYDGVDTLIERALWGTAGGAWVLIKTHTWMPRVPRDDVLVVYTRRNLADVAASRVRHMLRSSGKRNGSELSSAEIGLELSRIDHAMMMEKYAVAHYALTIVDYDEYFGNDRKLLALMADKMRIDITDAELAEAARFIAIDRVKDIGDKLTVAGDPKTFIQRYHVSDTLGRPGAGLAVLPEPIVARLRALGQWPAEPARQAEREMPAAIAPWASIDLAAIFDDDDRVHFDGTRAVAETRVYNWYAAYGAALAPASLLEIGVRRGYGAYALIKGAGERLTRYVGIDMELDLAGSNAAAERMIRGLGVADVTLIRANTQTAFPAVAGPFDVVHVDGDHSMRGALSDAVNVLPLLAHGGTIIMDDVESAPVAAAVRLLRHALGETAAFSEHGDLHRQTLIRFTGAAPTLTLERLIAAAPAEIGGVLQLERACRQLRALPPAATEAEIAEHFGAVTAAAAHGLGDGELALALAGEPCRTADQLAATFADTVAALSRVAGQHGLQHRPWEREADEHGPYALARLDDVALPPRFTDTPRVPDAFRRGAPGFASMLHEAACNFSAIIERGVHELQRSHGSGEQR